MYAIIMVIFISATAGIVGTGLGGFVGAFLGKKDNRSLACVLGFASGVMLGIVCIDLIPHAMVLSQNLVLVIVSVLIGAILVLIITHFVNKNELNSLEKVTNKQTTCKPSLYKAGLIMFFAIALHNLPEGMAIGASIQFTSKALTLAILLAIHNIPEGMSIASPLVASGMSRAKAIFLSALSGATTVIGAIIGFAISSTNYMFTALSVGFASGAMLYVTFGELIPETIELDDGYLPAMFMVFGIIVSFVLINILS